PLEEAIGREAIERYEAALASLRPEEQEAVVGRIELGYTYDELAQALGKPTGEAARKAAERALVRLVEGMTRWRGDANRSARERRSRRTLSGLGVRRVERVE